MLTASYLYAGYSDYWSGYGETDCEEYSEHLLYAYYGRNTSLHDIIDQLVEDSYNGPAGETLPEDVTQDDVRAALLDMLTAEGLADYVSGAVASCSVAWGNCNNPEGCPVCECPADGEDEEECPECGHVLDNDEDYESPIFVVVLRYEKGEE